MEEFKLTDIRVKRVLFILSRGREQKNAHPNDLKSLKEMTDLYNQIFPPSIIGRLVGTQLSETSIKNVLGFLVTEKLVLKEILTFTDRYLKTPKTHYRLSQTGLQRVPKKF
ncbi:MAG: hypothetical protein NUW00_00370 [Candidatus Kaiserbacteria bacterium]|nr:hypothetical protein [Candidatus Kaiserbacteria bacterium]